MKLVPVVYRDLLVAARALDRSAAFRALVSSNMLERPVVGERKTRLPHVEAFNRELLAFLQNRSYYLPSRDRASVESIVRDRFRVPLDSSLHDRTRALDTAFVALKALNDRMAHAVDCGVLDASLGFTISPQAPRKTTRARVQATRTKLVKELTIAQALREKAIEKPPLTVRLAENVTTGVFLLAHPMLNGIFSRAVIVLTDHSASKGTKGFIVNQPTKVPLMKRFKVHPRIMRAFGSSKVRKGGPLRTEFAEILHSQSDLGGERVVASNFKTTNDDDLFQGIDLDEAAKAVETGKLKQTDVVFINGMSSWTAGQLDGEMQRGTWIAVSAPLSVAVSAQKDLWAEMMGRLGGEYEAFSRMPIVDEGDEFDDVEEDDEDFEVSDLDERGGQDSDDEDDDEDDDDDDDDESAGDDDNVKPQ